MKRVRQAALLLCLTAWPTVVRGQNPLPPPPPPRPVLVHANVWFDPGSSEPLAPRGIDPIAYWAPRLADPNITIITVDGHTDTAGSSDYNIELSEQRARRVAERLVAEGASAEKIVLIACGETRLNKPTLDGVSEPLNRTVGFNWNYRRADAAPFPVVEPIVPGCRSSRYLATD